MIRRDILLSILSWHEQFKDVITVIVPIREVGLSASSAEKKTISWVSIMTTQNDACTLKGTSRGETFPSLTLTWEVKLPNGRMSNSSHLSPLKLIRWPRGHLRSQVKVGEGKVSPLDVPFKVQASFWVVIIKTQLLVFFSADEADKPTSLIGTMTVPTGKIVIYLALF